MNTMFNKMDLDLDNYTLQDLCKLFQINSNELSYEDMKNAKKIVLMTHPDKSKLSKEYFIFFSKAYKIIHQVYTFQNKSTNKKTDYEDYVDIDDESKRKVINKLFHSKSKYKEEQIQSPIEFNKWFNETFDLYNQNETNKGYGDWLKSNENFYENSENVTKANLHEEFENKKKQAKTLVKYNGIHDTYSNNVSNNVLGCSILNEPILEDVNYSSGLYNNGNLGYQDLKQAYIETIIPVSEEDYMTIPKFKSEQEYRFYRDTELNNARILTEEESLKVFKNNEIHDLEESSRLAYFYAKESEKNQEKNKTIWSKIMQITNK